MTAEVTQAHRERELAQGILGTADHDTRARRTGQSRVPHTHGQESATTHRRREAFRATAGGPVFFPGAARVARALAGADRTLPPAPAPRE